MANNRVRFLVAIFLAAIAAQATARERVRQPRYVIFLMADGMGVDELEMGRQYSLSVLGHDLFITSTLAEEGVCALMDTFSSSSHVTDSAAAATAWATGHKVKNGQIAIHPKTLEPLETVLEYYKNTHGFRTGIVSNDAITGASPAAWAAHVRSRNNGEEIARQFCDQTRPDVILGGGRASFLASKRRDKRDIIGDFVTRHGYRYVETARDLDRVQSGRVLGLFGDGILTAQIDRPPEGAREPLTSDMTEAALRILSAGRPKGFFLFVEECVPDKGGHGNDAAAVVQGVLELDRAVAAVYRFYRKHRGETLIVVTSDHETGGLQWLYNFGWQKKVRDSMRRDGEVDPVVRLASVRASINKAVAGLEEKLTPEQRARLRWRYRQFDFNDDLARAMKDGRRTLGRLGDTWKRVVMHLVATNTGAYYTQGTHSYAAVPLFAIGVGAERFRGHIDNAEVGRTLLRLAGRQDFRPTASGN